MLIRPLICIRVVLFTVKWCKGGPIDKTACSAGPANRRVSHPYWFKLMVHIPRDS